MKVLTVRQPWAGLVARGIKDVENRVWPPHGRDLLVGQRFGIHAGRTDDLYRWQSLRAEMDGELEHPLCRLHGVIIATVVLADVVRDSPSAWAEEGAWHWVLERPRLVRNPPAVRGAHWLWEWQR